MPCGALRPVLVLLAWIALCSGTQVEEVAMECRGVQHVFTNLSSPVAANQTLRIQVVFQGEAAPGCTAFPDIVDLSPGDRSFSFQIVVGALTGGLTVGYNITGSNAPAQRLLPLYARVICSDDGNTQRRQIFCHSKLELRSNLSFPVPLGQSLGITVLIAGSAAKETKIDPQTLEMTENATTALWALTSGGEGLLVLTFNLTGSAAPRYQLQFPTLDLKVVCPEPGPDNPTWWKNNSPWIVPTLIVLGGLLFFFGLFLKRRLIKNAVSRGAQSLLNALNAVRSNEQDVELDDGHAITKVAFFELDAEERPIESRPAAFALSAHRWEPSVAAPLPESNYDSMYNGTTNGSPPHIRNFSAFNPSAPGSPSTASVSKLQPSPPAPPGTLKDQQPFNNPGQPPSPNRALQPRALYPSPPLPPSQPSALPVSGSGAPNTGDNPLSLSPPTPLLTPSPVLDSPADSPSPSSQSQRRSAGGAGGALPPGHLAPRPPGLKSSPPAAAQRPAPLHGQGPT
mmetsp:Transcript_15335/g.36200  ORF Transcript_15335/g.36200 Transcript_15335/m.36200 type:complete len:511 (-) Transcript_15335:658-2190(-)